ncbi:hypothetical protein [Actinoplanes sp. NPDC051494]|uniref:hypothetical protein n=1 Tax=Actinoplanes sp. NPDC051494 TaxID=3363907 RepID=UPI0037A29FF3
MADLPNVWNLPPRWSAGLVALGGLTIFAIALVMVHRRWNQALGWEAVGAVALAVIGALLTFSSPILLSGPASGDQGGVASSASLLPEKPSVIADGDDGDDLDPAIEASGMDLRLKWFLSDRPIVEGARYHVVKTASEQACSEAPRWDTAIAVAPGMLVCVITDRKRYVVIKIQSEEKPADEITYRVVYVGEPTT